MATAQRMKVSPKSLVTVSKATLDGKPARITGSQNSFATVSNGTASVEFAWITVQHIVDSKNAAFKS